MKLREIDGRVQNFNKGQESWNVKKMEFFHVTAWTRCLALISDEFVGQHQIY